MPHDRSLPTRLPVLLALVFAVAHVETARGAVLCAKARSDGTFNGGVVIREVCKSKETTLDPAALGLQGPPGPNGDPGPGLTSLAGVPCDTGSPEQPDGRTVTSVDATTGALTLRCVSASTNPLLSVALLAGPLRCSGSIVTVCALSRFSLQEVDATGQPVPAGFLALAGPATQSPFPVTYETRRFASGAIVRLRAVGSGFTSGLVPTWTGCDAVNGDLCTLTLTSAATVTVLPTAP